MAFLFCVASFFSLPQEECDVLSLVLAKYKAPHLLDVGSGNWDSGKWRVKFNYLLKSSETKCDSSYLKRNPCMIYGDPSLLVCLVELASCRGNRHKKTL